MFQILFIVTSVFIRDLRVPKISYFILIMYQANSMPKLYISLNFIEDVP